MSLSRTVTFGNENDDEKEEFDKPEEQTLSKPIINKPKPTRSPLLFIDVSIGPDQTERIIVYEDDTAIQLAEEFSKEHNLNSFMKQKLVELLNMEISGVLDKIEEENSEYLSDDF